MSLGQYAGTSEITLYDGTVISDPATTQATQAQCLPFECGVDPTNSDVRYWCGFWGQIQTPACEDPQCAPYRAQVPGCNVVASTPQIPNPPQPAVAPVMLTPQSIVQPMPNITQANAPVPLPVSDGSCWCQLNQWIDQNPILAGLILVGFGLAVLPRGGR
jgi:hypothetical protein